MSVRVIQRVIELLLIPHVLIRRSLMLVVVVVVVVDEVTNVAHRENNLSWQCA